MRAEEEERTETLPFVMKHLPDYFQEKAQKELNETPERKITALEELKEMARNHKLTCDIHFVDDYLLQFLRHRKYDVCKAFKHLVNITSFVRDRGSLFRTINSDILFSHPSRQIGYVLPRRSPEGCTIMLVELDKWDPQVISYHDLWQLGILQVIQSLRDPMTQINGVKVIYDFTNTSLKHACCCRPSNLYEIYHAMMNCFPLRLKAVHLVSESLVMKTMWTVLKPLLSQKLKQRIFMNSSRKDLLNHFPPSVLPVKYGGVLEDYYTTEWTKEANKQQEGFGLEGQCNYY